MAPELRSRKAKAVVAEVKPAPAKKSTSVKAAKSPKTEKRKAVEDASPVATKKVKATKTKAKKVVEEEKGEEEEEEKVVTPAKSKGKAKGKKAAPVVSEPMDEDEDEDEDEAPTPAPVPTPKSALKKSPAAPKTNGNPVSEKKNKSTKKSATPAKKEVERPEKEASDDDELEEEGEDDEETQALVRALESSDDEAAEEEKDKAQKGTYKKGQDVGKIPKQQKKGAKSAKAAPPAIKGKPGVVYLARIPHGFYEHQIRAYFSQFGPINHVRVARNKKTGASRHRAFIEFAEAETADIAARTMDKYLLFGHILTAKVVPPEQVHPNLFKGSNRRFKVVPWNKMQGKQLERPLPESKWAVKISKEEERRAKRAEKLKEMGYEFEAPKLKVAEAKEALPAAEGAEKEAIEGVEKPAAIEAPVEDEQKAEAADEEKTQEKAEETPVKKAAKKEKASGSGSAAKAKKGRRSSTK